MISLFTKNKEHSLLKDPIFRNYMKKIQNKSIFDILKMKKPIKPLELEFQSEKEKNLEIQSKLKDEIQMVNDNTEIIEKELGTIVTSITNPHNSNIVWFNNLNEKLIEINNLPNSKFPFLLIALASSLSLLFYFRFKK
jgi:hypothetical protein